MKRELKNKELYHTRLANNYGGWIYCSQCGKTIGYLCYVTYDKFRLKYECKCGNQGEIALEFEDSEPSILNNESLLLIKNRSCCPTDQSPLFTILSEKLRNYEIEVVCHDCHNRLVLESNSQSARNF